MAGATRRTRRPLRHQGNPCPFCGFASARVLPPGWDQRGPDEGGLPKGFQVECLNCGARGPCGMRSTVAARMAWDLGDGGYTRPVLLPTALPWRELPAVPVDHPMAAPFGYRLYCEVMAQHGEPAVAYEEWLLRF